MLKQKILEDFKAAVKNLGYPSTDIVISIPKNSSFGDYTSNMALQLAKLKSAKGKQTSLEIANEIVEQLKSFDSAQDNFNKIEIAGGGFINFFVKDSELIKKTKDLGLLPQSPTPQKILIEYGHVNPLKEIHIGHLRTFILGESLCRIYEAAGHKVFRANYQGDIGLHIAKAIWGIEKLGLPSRQLNLEEKAEFLGKAYVEGNKSYEEDPVFKEEIDKMNIKLYQKDPEIQKIYQLARSWSLEYFEPIYQLLGIKYDRCFFESEVYERGKQIVLENLGSPREAGKVFEENAGAIIFPGEKYSLHTRVFITTAGNPTYESKEIGLAELEYDTFNYEKSIHVVASEQGGYFQVVIKAIELIFPYLKHKKYHLSYGVVDLSEGKMSSRAGNVVTFDDLYHVVSEKVREIMKQGKLEIDQEIVRMVALGAIKFSYLKFSPQPNMVFNLEESVSLDGDSGPYIQYTFARIQSVLKKAFKASAVQQKSVELVKEERLVLRQLLYFPDVVEEALIMSHPNLIASYLIELSKFYNLFYQKCRMIGSEKEDFRLKLSLEVGKVLKKGLDLLGIEAPERM